MFVIELNEFCKTLDYKNQIKLDKHDGVVDCYVEFGVGCRVGVVADKDTVRSYRSAFLPDSEIISSIIRVCVEEIEQNL